MSQVQVQPVLAWQQGLVMLGLEGGSSLDDDNEWQDDEPSDKEGSESDSF